MRYGWRAKIGLLVMFDDSITEPNIDDIFGRIDGISSYAARLNYPIDDCTVEGLARLYDDVDKATIQLASLKPNVICFCCTSGSVVIGEQKLLNTIKANAQGASPTTTITAVKNAFKELGLTKIAMGTPYIDEINAIEHRHLEDAGFSVVNVEGLQIRSSSAICALPPEPLYELGKSVDRPEADCVFISCGGLNMLPVIEQLERDIGKPVITSNTAIAWDVLRKANVRESIDGCGILLRS
jgi:maleate isomerase